MQTLLITGGVILVIILIIVGMYNGLIRKKNAIENAFGTIDVMLKKRHDLIPNMVETVKQYMDHERGTLSEIVKLRSQIISTSDLSYTERVNLENQLTKKLQGVQVSFENYPDLKSNTNFLQLQGTLNEVESQLAASRRAFNAAVLDYNNGIESFPSNIMAGMMGLKEASYFEIPEVERENPSIKGLFNS